MYIFPPLVPPCQNLSLSAYPYFRPLLRLLSTAPSLAPRIRQAAASG